MDGNDFELKKEGSTLQVYLGFELSIDNSAELRKMLSDDRGQDISKIGFDATDLVFISSSGIRATISWRWAVAMPTTSYLPRAGSSAPWRYLRE